MEHRRLGHSGISVSVLSLGSWLTFEYVDEEQALAVIARGIEGGIDFFDDARYDDRTGKAPLPTGYSEVVFGRLLRKGGWQRADLTIANKLWFEFYPKQSVAEELQGSLGRLQMDYLDIVYCAEPPESLPLLEMMQQLERLIVSGTLRAWGILNWSADKLAEACALGKVHGLRLPCAAQLPYSVLQRRPVEDPRTEQVCDMYDITVVSSYSLHGGLLSGKYAGAAARRDHRLDQTQLAELRRSGALDKAERFVAAANDIGCTPAQLAIAYCLENPRVSTVLFGAKTVNQMEENLGALKVVSAMDESALTRLRAIAS